VPLKVAIRSGNTTIYEASIGVAPFRPRDPAVWLISCVVIRSEVEASLSSICEADLYTSSGITLGSASLIHYAPHHLPSLPN
jgi:hypothetical protein